MNRVVIAGCPGAGKTTAAKRLGALSGLPVVHLDQHYWKPDWTRPETADWVHRQRSLCEAPRWIMDGNYGSTLNIRLEAADTVLVLDYPTLTCVRRLLMRVLFGLGRNLDGAMPEGCRERIDIGFFRFVLNYRKHRRLGDLKQVMSFEGRRHIFGHPRELDAFFAGLQR